MDYPHGLNGCFTRFLYSTYVYFLCSFANNKKSPVKRPGQMLAILFCQI